MNQTSSTLYGIKRPLWYLKKLLAWQREAPLNTPISQRIDMWRRGYRASSYALHDLYAPHASEYLPDRVRVKTLFSQKKMSTFFINGPFAHSVLNDKLLFSALLAHKLPIPRTLALIERGQTFVYGQDIEDSQDVLDLVRTHRSVILKPSGGSRGAGIYRLDREPELTLNGSAVTPEHVRQHVQKLDDYLVTETAQQAAYARAIYPDAANSLRIMTFIDPDTNEPFIACGFHRFGTPESKPTDNWSRGGLISRIDLKTGVVGPGVKHVERTGGKLIRESHHPDTEARIEGVQIPRWHEVCEGLLETVRTFPFFLYVGWDVVVTEKGFVVIEGNKNPDFVQVHGGWLNDPKMRRFYEYHQVI